MRVFLASLAILVFSGCAPKPDKTEELIWHSIDSSVATGIDIENVEEGFVNGRSGNLLSVRSISQAGIFFVISKQAFKDELKDVELFSPGQLAKDPEGVTDRIYGNKSWVVSGTIQSGIQGLYFWANLSTKEKSSSWEPITFEGGEARFELLGEPVMYGFSMYLLLQDYKLHKKIIMRLPDSGQVSYAVIPSEVTEIQLVNQQLVLKKSTQEIQIPLPD